MATTKGKAPSGGVLQFLELKKLRLDPSNARFGTERGQRKEQSDILDHIVTTFGVDDVLSSLSVNGYFDAEPLVGREEKDGTVTIIEGNRRLASCLILSGDDRAARQQTKGTYARKVWEANGRPSVGPVPVIVYPRQADKKALLSYLGVRHIQSSQPWDSYAKAAWIHEVVEDGNLSLKDVAEMIGDQHRTVHRMLQGYYFIRQLIETGRFRPEDSQRKGRGSVTDFPFSWVYTFLGYGSARDYVGISDDTADPKPLPIPPRKLNDAGLAVKAMFGDKSKGRSAAIEDSRELGDLASAFADPIKVGLLREGRPLSEIILLTKPIDARLNESLLEVRGILRDLVSSMGEQEIEKSLAQSVTPVAEGNQKLAETIVQSLKAASVK